MSLNRTPFGMIILVSIFSLCITFICDTSFSLSLGCLLRPEDPQSYGFRNTIFNVLVSELGYFAGGFIFGTLSNGILKTWKKTLILIAPNFIVRFATFALAFYDVELKQQMVASEMPFIVIPILVLILSPLVSYFGIISGESSAANFSRPKSVLNISWHHWLWILPFYLFSVSGVTSFLFFFLTSYDARTDTSGYFSIFSIFSSFSILFFRAIILGVIAVVGISISSVYLTLSKEGSSLSISSGAKVFANWLFLTIFEFFIVSSVFNHMIKK